MKIIPKDIPRIENYGSGGQGYPEKDERSISFLIYRFSQHFE
jgi:hypothetical protein